MKKNKTSSNREQKFKNVSKTAPSPTKGKSGNPGKHESADDQ